MQDFGRSNHGMCTGVSTQGGIIFWTHTFTSKMALLDVVMKGETQGCAFAAFLDATSIFTHDRDLVDSSYQHKVLAKAGVTRSIKRNYIYARTAKSIEAGEKIAVLTSAVKW